MTAKLFKHFSTMQSLSKCNGNIFWCYKTDECITKVAYNSHLRYFNSRCLHNILIFGVCITHGSIPPGALEKKKSTTLAFFPPTVICPTSGHTERVNSTLRDEWREIKTNSLDSGSIYLDHLTKLETRKFCQTDPFEVEQVNVRDLFEQTRLVYKSQWPFLSFPSTATKAW